MLKLFLVHVKTIRGFMYYIFMVFGRARIFLTTCIEKNYRVEYYYIIYK